MNIQPLGNRVLIKKEQNKEEVHSGIIVPNTNQDMSNSIGSVVAVGPGEQTEKGEMKKPDVSVGDKVVFSWGEKVEIKGEEHYIVSSESILGIVK